MAKVRSWASLDVHARSVLAVALDATTGEIGRQRLSAETATVVEFLAKLPGATRVAYEAGPTGYGLARAFETAGIGCVVAAPGKIERPAQDKVKTDVRDAERVLRLLMIDALVSVRVPTVEEEGSVTRRHRLTSTLHATSVEEGGENPPTRESIGGLTMSNPQVAGHARS